MSRHIRAQKTPTHASGFHLFTVAMTGHAKDKGVQLPQQVTDESVLSPLDRRGSDDEFDDTDEELYDLRKCQASKTPLFIPIQSHSLAPALFYCIRTTTFHLLLVAVVEPLSSA